MKLSVDVKPITYLKNHAAELIGEVAGSGRTVLITQHGEAKAVVMDVATYDAWQTALALLKMAAQGEEDVRAGRTMPMKEAFDRVRNKLRSGDQDG